MLTKNKIKYIKSLQLKKYRKKEQSFIAEGAKTVLELLHSDHQITTLVCTDLFLQEHKNITNNGDYEIIQVSEKELSSLGTFENNNTALAVARMKENRPVNLSEGEFAIALDDVRDPGNLGTIIRIADWYGIKKLICSDNTAELYNPKVINSSMGSFTRVEVSYCDLEEFIRKCSVPVYGAFLEGENVHQLKQEAAGVILMGNEANGISAGVASLISRKINIPRFGQAESLNVAIATAVLCDNLIRVSVKS
jgi:RNA methyltransferase, TrmH family